GGIEQPGAIEIGSDTGLARRGADRDGICLREDDPTAEIVGVLDRHQSGGRQHDVARRLRGSAEIRGGEQTAMTDRGELDAGIGRPGAGFIHIIWASLPRITSSPGRVSNFSAIWLAIVPLGTNSPASLPSSSAIRS